MALVCACATCDDGAAADAYLRAAAFAAPYAIDITLLDVFFAAALRLRLFDMLPLLFSLFADTPLTRLRRCRHATLRFDARRRRLSFHTLTLTFLLSMPPPLCRRVISLRH